MTQIERQCDTDPMTRYWAIWFALAFGTFIVPETIALATGHPERTLSGAIWRMEALKAGEPVTGWTFAHFAFTSVFALTTLWLIGHFGFGWWR